MFKSINPYTGQKLGSYSYNTTQEINTIFEQSEKAFDLWRQVNIEERALQIKKIGSLLLDKKEAAAKIITEEMGKPIKEAISEIEKCALLCDYYEENVKELLKNNIVSTVKNSYVVYDPLGSILGIMPWNFPFWQVMRFAIPTVMIGNTVILKHASNVPECALFLEKIFKEALSVENVYQNIFCSNRTTEHSIGNDAVKGVSLTGSNKAGLSVAQTAAKHLKPIVLELGGSNALVAFEDVDIDKTVAECVNARFVNNGQSCIAGKRLLIHESIKQKFIDKLIAKVQELKVGDPLDMSTDISVLAN